MNESISLAKTMIQKVEYLRRQTREKQQSFITFTEKVEQLPNNVSSMEMAKARLYCEPTNHVLRTGEYVLNNEMNLKEGNGMAEKFGMTFCQWFQFRQKKKFDEIYDLMKKRKSLPIASFKNRIVDTVDSNQVVLIAGDTGCGKSTQIPQFLMEKYPDLQIVCTQPRRIACMSLCKRVSYESLNKLTEKVGYQIRFEKSTHNVRTKLTFMTEGLLLKLFQSDQKLGKYSIIILDEIHERHAETDFVLGIIRCLIDFRTDLKVVLMSATINLELFQSYFKNAPVVKIPGRLYPIDVRYDLAQSLSSLSVSVADLIVRCMQLIDRKYPHEERGDVLVFVAGLSDIVEVCEKAQSYADTEGGWVVLPLHSTLSEDQQDRIFHVAPDGHRKMIVSTNIAETSITVDGVRFVIDSGQMKEMVYDATSQIHCLKKISIAKASAEQRKGRAGRTGPGVCFRLYTQNDYLDMQSFMTPEILRCSLSCLILQMAMCGLQNLRNFPFIDKPDNLEASLVHLQKLGLMDATERVTWLGSLLSDFPMEPQLSRMLVLGTKLNLPDQFLTLCAAISVQSPFSSLRHNDSFRTTGLSDLLASLEAWTAWNEAKHERKHVTNWCRQHGLDQHKLYEMNKLRQQFWRVLRQHDLVEGFTEEEDAEEDTRGDPEIADMKKRLRRLKRKRMYEETGGGGAQKRKVLNENIQWNEDQPVMNDGSADSSSATDGSDLVDQIRHLEFALSTARFAKSATGSGSFSRDSKLFKVVVSVCLAPNLAVGDSANAHRADDQQVFHTLSKQQVLIHPSSAPFKQIRNIDHQHDIISFGSLLHTKSIYAMGVHVSSLLPTLLASFRKIDACPNVCHVMLDDWIMLDFCESKLPKKRNIGPSEQCLLPLIHCAIRFSRCLDANLSQHSRQKNPTEMANETPCAILTDLIKVCETYQIYISWRKVFEAENLLNHSETIEDHHIRELVCPSNCAETAASSTSKCGDQLFFPTPLHSLRHAFNCSLCLSKE